MVQLLLRFHVQSVSVGKYYSGDEKISEADNFYLILSSIEGTFLRLLNQTNSNSCNEVLM